MDKGTEHAYKWAKGQNYRSVAADYARVLAIEIDRLNAELARVTRELEGANMFAVLCDEKSIWVSENGGRPYVGNGFHARRLYERTGGEVRVWAKMPPIEAWRGLPDNAPTVGETGDETRGGGTK